MKTIAFIVMAVTTVFLASVYLTTIISPITTETIDQFDYWMAHIFVAANITAFVVNIWVHVQKRFKNADVWLFIAILTVSFIITLHVTFGASYYTIFKRIGFSTLGTSAGLSTVILIQALCDKYWFRNMMGLPPRIGDSVKVWLTAPEDTQICVTGKVKAIIHDGEKKRYKLTECTQRHYKKHELLDQQTIPDTEFDANDVHYI